MKTTKAPRAAAKLAQHTPGPWRVARFDGMEIEITGPRRPWPVHPGHVQPCDAQIVASVRPFVGSYAHYPRAIARKNARLIAAAPELLAALKRRQEADLHNITMPLTNKDVERERLAIAKAEGRK